MKDVTETERVRDLLERALAVIDCRTRPLEAAALLVPAGGFARELDEALPEVLVVEPDLPGHILGRQPAVRTTVAEQAQAFLQPRVAPRVARAVGGGGGHVGEHMEQAAEGAHRGARAVQGFALHHRAEAATPV